MTDDLARRLVIVDFEPPFRTGRGRRSHPIEVEGRIPEAGEIGSRLIKPERIWLDNWDWHCESQ